MVIQTILRINVLAYRNGFGLSLMKTWNVNIFRENNNTHMVPGRGDLLWVFPLQFPRKPAEGSSGGCGYQSRRVPTGPAARVSPSLALCSQHSVLMVLHVLILGRRLRRAMSHCHFREALGCVVEP